MSIPYFEFGISHFGLLLVPICITRIILYMPWQLLKISHKLPPYQTRLFLVINDFPLVGCACIIHLTTSAWIPWEAVDCLEGTTEHIFGQGPYLTAVCMVWSMWPWCILQQANVYLVLFATRLYQSDLLDNSCIHKFVSTTHFEIHPRAYKQTHVPQHATMQHPAIFLDVEMNG